MSNVITYQRFWQRRDTAANWTAANPVLAGGEVGVELGAAGTPARFKIGDGVTAWTSLAYLDRRTTDDLTQGATNLYFSASAAVSAVESATLAGLMFAEGAAPGTPASGQVRLYAKADGRLYSKDDAGTETALIAGMTNPMTTIGDVIYGDTGGTPARLPAGTNGYVLTMVAGAPAWASVGGGGSITGFTASLATAAPNATVNVSALTASGGSTNQDAALIAKGTGATTAQMADGATAGGNKRGAQATDWQKDRSVSTQVASGSFSVIGGGSGNTCAGTHGTVAGGDRNSASNGTAVVGGGQLNTASGIIATVSGGALNLADGYASWIPGGYQATARGTSGAGCRASGFFSVRGDAQSRCFTLRSTTSGAVQSTLTTDGAAAGAANQLVLVNNMTFLVKGTVIARDSTAARDSAAWEFSAVIKRGASAAATVMVAACTPVAVAADAGAAAWVLTIDADTTTGCLRIRGTGEAGKTVRWVCDVYSCLEVAH